MVNTVMARDGTILVYDPYCDLGFQLATIFTED